MTTESSHTYLADEVRARHRSGLQPAWDDALELADAVDTLAAETADAEAVMLAIVDATSGPGDGPTPEQMLAGVTDALTLAAAERARAKWAALVSERNDLREQVARLTALQDVFLNMRDRVGGYSGAAPVAQQFQKGVSAFEWAATNVRRATAGEPPLNPPVPIRKLGKCEQVTESYLCHVSTCDTCDERFVGTVRVHVEHDEEENGYVNHYGRVIPDEETP